MIELPREQAVIRAVAWLRKDGETVAAAPGGWFVNGIPTDDIDLIEYCNELRVASGQVPIAVMTPRPPAVVKAKTAANRPTAESIGAERIDRVILRCAERFGLLSHEVRRPSRTAAERHARMAASWLARHLTNRPLHEIATRLHASDHKVVRYHIQKLPKALAADPAYCDIVAELAVRLAFELNATDPGRGFAVCDFLAAVRQDPNGAMARLGQAFGAAS